MGWEDDTREGIDADKGEGEMSEALGREGAGKGG